MVYQYVLEITCVQVPLPPPRAHDCQREQTFRTIETKHPLLSLLMMSPSYINSVVVERNQHLCGYDYVHI